MRYTMLAAAAALAFAATGSANAETILRTEFLMPTQSCQAALPVFDTALRKRPLGYQNEGTSNTFVTCGLVGANNAAPLVSLGGLFLRNNTAAEIVVNCTMVDAGSGFNTPVYVPRSVTVAANTSSTLIAWSAADNTPAGTNFIYPSISCALPPGIGITAVPFQYQEEIGQVAPPA